MEEQRREFVQLAMQPGGNVARLSSRFGISRKTAYKWLARFKATGELAELSRRPRHSPAHTSSAVEARILELRQAEPTWGGRKLRRRLLDLGAPSAPAASTITEVLRRHGCLRPEDQPASGPWRRFERARCNDLWQMDFKGWVPCRDGRCHPLTALDDCSRYAVVLRACADQRRGTVQSALIEAFERYGLPWEMLMDNGSPWSGGGEPQTALTVWLMRLGIVVTHGRPFHPQTQGKEERFHRTLKADLTGNSMPWSMEQCQQQFDGWRHRYNTHRPHEALQMDTPIKRYQVSPRAYPAALPEIFYEEGEEIRRVTANGWVFFAGRELRLSRALVKQPVAFRPDPLNDGRWTIRFCRQQLAQIDLHAIPKGKRIYVTHLSEHM